MGFTGLARWTNAPTTGLDLLNQNILRNHGGVLRGKWSLSVKSYRSIPSPTNNLGQMTSDRTMCAVTMGENVFVLLEDPSAPTRADVVNANHASQTTDQNTIGTSTQDTNNLVLDTLPHYRTTYITVTPHYSLELLLAQLRARWQSVRQATAQARGQTNTGTGGAQLTIEGHIFAIGTDWLVRAGNVILVGGTMRGILLEAEYLPLQVMPVQSTDGTSELLSNLLTSLLPRVSDAKTVAVTIPPGQWDEVLYSGDSSDDVKAVEEEEDSEWGPRKPPKPEGAEEEVVDDVYVYGTPPLRQRKGDWHGIDRDRRAAFLIIGALKSEGLL